MIESSVAITDLKYIDYHYKQWKELTYEQQVFKANNVKFANNFSFINNKWMYMPYYGFGMISMLNQNVKNDVLTQHMIAIQEKFIHLLVEKVNSDIYNKIYLLPENSFHQTIANALSNIKYNQLIVEKGIEHTFHENIKQVISEYKCVFSDKSIRMKMIGLGIFGNAIGALGVFDDPYEYNSILNFRDHFYNHEISSRLGIQKTRPFIGHITLAYIESDLSLIERKALVEVASSINEQWQNEKHYFFIDSTYLTSFTNLASFSVIENINQMYF